MATKKERPPCFGTATMQDACTQCPDNNDCADYSTRIFREWKAMRKEICSFAQWLEGNNSKDNPLGLSPESTRGWIVNEYYARFVSIIQNPEGEGLK